MKLTICAAYMAAIVAFTGCATQDKAKDSAINGQAADIGTTAMGLAMGAAEANPLGLGALGVKYWLTQSALKEKDDCKRAAKLNGVSAAGYGPAANNICIITVIATGGAGALLCPVLGLGVFFAKLSDGVPEVLEVCNRERWPEPDLETVPVRNASVVWVKNESITYSVR